MAITIDLRWILGIFGVLIFVLFIYTLRRNFFISYGLQALVGGFVFCIVCWIVVLTHPDLGWKAIFGLGAGLLTFLYVGIFFGNKIDAWVKRHPHAGDNALYTLIILNFIFFLWAMVTGLLFGFFSLGVGILLVALNYENSKIKKDEAIQKEENK